MIKADIKEFDKALRQFTSKIKKFQKSMENGLEELKTNSLDILNDGINEAFQDYYNYQDEDKTLDQYKGDIEVNENKDGNNFSFEFNIGKNSKIPTKNGELVNAFYFLCYGYGYIGEFNSLSSSSVVNWDYDINNHGEEGWNYKSSDGTYKWSNGILGYDFVTPVYENMRLNGYNIVINSIMKGIKK